jgi:hypothetical protein
MFMVCYARPSERGLAPKYDLDRRLSAAGHRG